MKFKPGLIAVLAVMAMLVQQPLPLVCQNQKSQNSLTPTVSSATDGIFAAFQHRPIVALGDDHGLAQEEDFYVALVRDKRFAAEVGNVVVEFGDAAQQATLDRYLAGDEIPYEELRRVWSDTVGWIPTVNALGYMNFFAQVREINRTLPPNKRIKIWLGDPPIDWSSIKTHEDFLPKLNQRNQYPAELIKTEILAKKKKAVVIYGGFHFYGAISIRSFVEHDYPNTFYVVTPYRGFTDPACSGAFEQAIRNWPVPALAEPVRGTSLERLLQAENCHFLAANSITINLTVNGKPLSPEERARMMADFEGRASGVAGDALLYLGPASTLTNSPKPGDLYLDSGFRREIERRSLIEFGQPLDLPIPPASPQYLHPSTSGLSQ
jgi:hypothetical protein